MASDVNGFSHGCKEQVTHPNSCTQLEKTLATCNWQTAQLWKGMCNNHWTADFNFSAS